MAQEFKFTLEKHTHKFVCIEELILKELVDTLESMYTVEKKDEIQRNIILAKLENSPIYKLTHEE